MAGTPLLRIDRGRYVLADARAEAKIADQADLTTSRATQIGPVASRRIFISYRRDDAGSAAGWLSSELGRRFGTDQVFKDVDSIEPGDDFTKMIATAVGSCADLLAVIGPRWLTAVDEDGQRRLDDPADLVRMEIEAALARGVRVIPVLVDGARMPRREEVPASLTKLVTRHAAKLRPDRFNADLDPLLNVLGKTFASSTAVPQPVTPPARHPPVAPPGTRRLVIPSAGDWNGTDYYVRFGFGNYDRRSWEDARRWSFISTGGGSRWTKPLQQLRPGARIFVHHTGYGYVGIGSVLQSAVSISDFTVMSHGESMSLLRIPLRNEAIKAGADDPELAEQVVRVRWDWTVPDSQGIWQPHFFSRLTTVAELRDPHTAQRICEYAGLPVSREGDAAES